MPEVLPIEQTQRWFLLFARVIFTLSFVALIISLPFIIIAGIGLLATIPLVLFLVYHRDYTRSLINKRPLSPKNTKMYIVATVLSGLACSFGFFMMWGVSHGIDTVEKPVALYLYLAFGLAPLVTASIIFAVLRWNKISQL